MGPRTFAGGIAVTSTEMVVPDPPVRWGVSDRRAFLAAKLNGSGS
jgi:hypothetical protein